MGLAMAWLWLVDTSRHTDYMLLFAITCFDAALTLFVAIAAGLGYVAAALTVLLVVLLAATWYARSAWMREEATKAARVRKAFKIRLPR